MKALQRTIAGTAMLALLAATGFAQSKQSANRLAADNDFVIKAAQGGMAEVELGNLAAKQASNSKVKQFGRRMVNDHSKINEQLSQIASSKGITLPTTMGANNQATVNRFSKMTGAEFDKAYMQEMVKDHEEDVAGFKRETNSGDDPDVKAFATKILPTLQEHLKVARDALKQFQK